MRADSLNIPMIKGHGWVKEGVCGCAGKSLQWQYTDFRLLYAQLLKDLVLASPIDNFGRFNQSSRLAILSIALALYDANIKYSKDNKQDIGILGTSIDGALDSNLDYFRDYVQAGRKLGRGSFFIYTLASSPLAEAAINFGFQGPVLYLRHSVQPEKNLLIQAESMVADKEAGAIITVVLNSQEAAAHFVALEEK